MTDRPRYLRIADEIADDIRSGRLLEGQPAPSTRRIVRDWNVAMATATKVIGALRAADLVETIPGSGTIVRHRNQSAAAKPTQRERARLTQREIVEAGVRIADADGLPLVTMRRVADSLGVSTMALYRHVPNKGDLTLRMADSVFAGIRLPEIPIAAWRRRLDAAAHLFWAVFSRHPWAAEVFSISRPQLMPNVLPFAEWSFSTLRAMGFDTHDTLCTHINLFAHVRGMALALLAEAQAEKDTGMSADDWMAHQDRSLRQWADSAGHPGLGYVMREPFDFDLDTVFEYGLQRLLDGIDARRHALDRLLFSIEVNILSCMENNPSWLLPLLRSRVTGALLALLYLHPDRDYSLAEAGKAIGASPKVMSTEADRLVTSGLVREARRGQSRLIRAETSGLVSRPPTDLLAVTYGPLPVLSDLLSEVAGVEQAYIYGSWAARYLGEPGPAPHDVDVLVVGSADVNDIYDIAREAESRLGREVNISAISQQHWEAPDPADSFMRHVQERPLVRLEL